MGQSTQFMEKISLYHRISDFDGKMPFDFQNCCNIKDDKDVGKWSSLFFPLNSQF